MQMQQFRNQNLISDCQHQNRIRFLSSLNSRWYLLHFLSKQTFRLHRLQRLHPCRRNAKKRHLSSLLPRCTNIFVMQGKILWKYSPYKISIVCLNLMKGRPSPSKTAQAWPEKSNLHLLQPWPAKNYFHRNQAGSHSVHSRPLQTILRMPEVQVLHTTRPKPTSKLFFVFVYLFHSNTQLLSCAFLLFDRSWSVASKHQQLPCKRQ